MSSEYQDLLKSGLPLGEQDEHVADVFSAVEALDVLVAAVNNTFESTLCDILEFWSRLVLDCNRIVAHVLISCSKVYLLDDFP